MVRRSGVADYLKPADAKEKETGKNTPEGFLKETVSEGEARKPMEKSRRKSPLQPPHVLLLRPFTLVPKPAGVSKKLPAS